jgi:hypothetical protein
MIRFEAAVQGHTPSNFDQRPRKARARAIKKQAHAQSFFALNSDQAHVPANMAALDEVADLRLIVSGVAFQPGDSFLNGFAKTWADLEALLDRAIGEHGEHLTLGHLGP